ncbi:MAG: ABC transporter permease [Lachnospiraceae bacterium]|jgi:ABC-2 type transport system permease protein|nr:ABC transporter permease [Lachnospiraceae bacterium]
MKKYISFFRLRFSMGLQYRAAALAGVATQFFWGAMEILMFRAFYRTNPGAFPMTLQATCAYVWLQQAFLALFVTWVLENEIFDSILNGNIAYELCRPVNIYNMWFSRNLAMRISGAVLRCIPILLFAAFLPAPYGLMAPAGLTNFFLFFLTLLLGVGVTVAFCMLVYMLCFFTISPMGLRIVTVSMVEFLSGGIIPLPFLPDGVRQIIELLPFASMQNVPLRIYSGDLTGGGTLRALLLQVFWLCILVAAGKILDALAMKKVTVQGG